MEEESENDKFSLLLVRDSCATQSLIRGSQCSSTCSNASFLADCFLSEQRCAFNSLSKTRS